MGLLIIQCIKTWCNEQTTVYVRSIFLKISLCLVFNKEQTSIKHSLFSGGKKDSYRKWFCFVFTGVRKYHGSVYQQINIKYKYYISAKWCNIEHKTMLLASSPTFLLLSWYS